jgi:S1-C subfamily serine protease
MQVDRTGPSKSIIAVAVLIVVILATVAYYNLALGDQARTSSAKIGSLDSQIKGQQDTINALESQIASSTGQVNNSLNGINPSSIYRADNGSVVTIQGDATISVSTILGQESEAETVLGSGFVAVYLDSLYIVTNFHVVNGVQNLTVTFADGDAYPAKVVGTDPYSDLAVVTVNAPAKEFVPLQVISSANVEVGQPVAAIGNPYGLSGSMTFGIVSQLGRTIQEATAGNFSISGVIQFSAPINPGNSGGPLLNANGQVIGITTAMVNGSQGVGFAIPSSTILLELPSLISTGSYNMHAYLGISGVDMDYQLAQASHTNVTYGVLIEDVVSGGPAAAAGLRAGSTTITIAGEQYLVGGDVIISINGTKIVNQDALATYLQENALAGQRVQIGIIREGSLMTVVLTLGERPAPPS